ncbi:hypothetical protein K474DRAFT_1656439 [Panus rudis PR-1116 ss-1]|nr:hypothetical protein K474DRAFT_1656439 [Panus rudis PR-1116 ss-1]
MPPNLPGLYWDESKQRYFAIGRGPGGAGPSTTSATATAVKQKHRNQREGGSNGGKSAKRRKLAQYEERVEPVPYPERDLPWRSMERMKSTATYASSSRLAHDISMGNISVPCRALANEITDDPISSFSVVRRPDGVYTALIGDEYGWLYSWSSHRPHIPVRELYMTSNVRSVCLTNKLWIAVPFSNSCEIVVQEMDELNNLEWSTTKIEIPSCYDVSSANLCDTTVLLGAAKRGILLPDIVHSRSFQYLPTGSDVLSVHQTHHLAYTGSRNGAIHAFDKRANPMHKGQELLHNKFKSSNSSITHLSIVNDWELLISTVGGTLELYDLRFGQKQIPVMEFQGCSNQFTLKMGIAVSPCQQFLFAANDQREVLGWSMRTGERIHPQRMKVQTPINEVDSQALVRYDQRHPRVLEEPFPNVITTMQVTDGGGTEEDGLCLWLSSGRTLYRYYLGQRERH